MEEKLTFAWVKEQVQTANPILGEIKFEPFEGLKNLPQGFASAWSKAEEITGASYKPLICVGKQISKGINYWFIAEQTLITRTPEKNVITIAINEFNGNYTPINGSIVKIF